MEIYGVWGLPIAMVPCLHNGNDYIKRKLRVCRTQKCSLLVGANTEPTGTGLQTTPFHTAPYRADIGNYEVWGLPIVILPCLNQGDDYIKRKLRVCRTRKCRLLVGANTVLTGTGLQSTQFHTARYSTTMEIYGIWGLPIAIVPWLHQGNDYMKKKLRVCRAQKCCLLVGANTVPTGTGLQTTPFHTAPY